MFTKEPRICGNTVLFCGTHVYVQNNIVKYYKVDIVLNETVATVLSFSSSSY